jgi:hypothetical protein
MRAGDIGQVVEVGKGVIDDDEFRLEEFMKREILGEESPNGVVDFLTGALAGGIVKVLEFSGIELEHFEAFHLEPLIGEASDKTVGARVFEEAGRLGAEGVGFGELALAGEVHELGIWCGGPEEVAEADGKFAVGEGFAAR